MEFHLGAQVRNPDGDVLGTLQRVVYQPESSQVVSLVVLHTGWSEREVFVPIGRVNGADDEAVEIGLSSEQYDDLDIYSETRNVAPRLMPPKFRPTSSMSQWMFPMFCLSERPPAWNL
jgi:sporulation protein YlmC with PRC-barrel domain